MVMVPFYERRHRLSDNEVPAAIRGFELLLRSLLEYETDFSTAETAFRAWYRFTNHHSGRPSYPEPITWQIIREMVPFSGEPTEAEES